ncbi:unnamed protein product [Callosobruchus maculatus]|uniref:Major facilitator superfamily (MFS) profile domain-containing protein n=1 Tax=Callosobruchus maculatus TaxID=64391 RepID=A0A653CQ54_CALMS|nr:unnamed protein product [Callosobruchus maculatus]
MVAKCAAQKVEKKDDGKEWPQILAILIGCLMALENGMQFSWTSPFFLQLTKDKENYDITEEHASYFTTLPPIVLVLSCPLFSMLCDKIGRKAALLVGAVPYAMAWILEGFAKNVYLFHVARCLTGIGHSSSYAALSIYIGEIATPKVRSFWGNFFSISLSLGFLIMNLLGTYFDVRQTSYIGLVPLLLFVCTFPLMPESPYYLLMRGKEDEARRSLNRLRRKRDIEPAFLRLKADVARQMSETGTWSELFCITANRRALVAGVLMRFTQQFCLSSALSAYTRYIFEGAGTNADAFTLIYCAIAFIMGVVAGFSIHRFGRRRSFLVSMSLCSSCLLMLSIFYYIEANVPQIDVSSLSWVPLIGMSGYVVFSSFGVINIPTIMLGELFSASIKTKGVSVSLCSLGLLISLTNYLFFWMSTTYGMYFPFLFFSLSSYVFTGLCAFTIPETKGRTLEEIQQILSGNLIARKSLSLFRKSVQNPILEGTKSLA